MRALRLGREVLDSPPSRLEVLAALKALFEAGHPSLSQQLLQRLAQRVAEERTEFPQDLEQVLLAAAELETRWARPEQDHPEHVLQRCPVGDAGAVELAMDGFGEELGAAGACWLSSVMGAAPSPAAVLDVGAYCGGSALRLARHLPGLQRVQLCTGHTRQLLPAFANSAEFGAVFIDLWGSQYAEVLAPGLLIWAV
eukprot:s308_g7.t2